MNRLFYGDNLDILPRYVKDEAVDLVYLDPVIAALAATELPQCRRDRTA